MKLQATATAYQTTVISDDGKKIYGYITGYASGNRQFWSTSTTWTVDDLREVAELLEHETKDD